MGFSLSAAVSKALKVEIKNTTKHKTTTLVIIKKSKFFILFF
jgi:hypothetical protein